jgi:hypothetical protein
VTSSKYSAQEIWDRGCRDDALIPDDMKRFAAMARSRFHTFQMGISHAEGEGEASDQQLLGLIKGLATELNEHPGLKKVWLRMSISQGEVGSQVSLQLEKLEQRVVH